MEDASRLVTDLAPVTTLVGRTQQPKDDSTPPGLSPAIHRDLNVARSSRANVLLVGAEPAVVSLVGALVPAPPAGVMVRCDDDKLRLPANNAKVATVVLQGVEALCADAQRRLLEWLDAAKSETQVISTAGAPLLPLVESHEFNDTLYYRLNTVYIDLSE
jgi:hypothetical protein